ncbi:MAG: peptidylprolyl isomerase [Fibrobacter sp.]|nr:peptidylprolyl isomerase [Fibrobacter sp.]
MKLSILLTLLLTFVGTSSAQLLGGANLPVIKVGKVEYTQGKIDSLTRLLATQQAQGQQVPPEAMTQLRWAVIDNLVGQELLRLEAEALKLKANPKTVDSLITLFKSQFPSEDQFNKELRKSGSNQADFMKKIEKQVQSDMLLESKVPYPKEPTDKERRDYFAKHKHEAVVNDTISGVQIYLKIAKGESAQAITDKKRILDGLSAQLRARKITDLMTLAQQFQLLAAQYSDDPTAREQGGLLKPFVPKTMGNDFVKAIAKLKVGQVSDAFVGKNGVTIFLLTEKNDGKYESYEHKIEYILRLEKEKERQLGVKAYLDQLAKKYPVNYLNKDYTSPTGIGVKAQ